MKILAIPKSKKRCSHKPTSGTQTEPNRQSKGDSVTRRIRVGVHTEGAGRRRSQAGILLGPGARYTKGGLDDELRKGFFPQQKPRKWEKKGQAIEALGSSELSSSLNPDLYGKIKRKNTRKAQVLVPIPLFNSTPAHQRTEPRSSGGTAVPPLQTHMDRKNGSL